MNAKVARWGNSMGVRLPKSVVEQVALKSGDEVSVSVERDGAIVLKPRPGRLTLAKLLKGITPENRHGEADWGPGKGRETW